MKNVVMIAVVLVMLAGCVAGSPYGYSRGIGSQKQMAQYADPSRPVSPGQVAYEGINGMSGPYAAALGLGSIPDASIRADAKEAILAISENENNWGGYGGNGNPRQCLGRITNGYPFPITVIIRGVARWDIPASGCVAVQVPMISGSYRAEIYQAGGVRPFTHRTFSLLTEGVVRGDKVFFLDEVV